MSQILRPHDWALIVRDLERAAMTCRSIGKIVGTSHTAVLKWKNEGQQPLHHTGERLLTLWCAVTGNPRSAAHLESTVSKEMGTFQVHRGDSLSTFG